MAELPSGTVTFLFTDVEGSTQLLQRLGRDGYERVLAEHDRILRAALTAYRGRVVDTQGDSFFAAFGAARDAVSAAAQAQRELNAATWVGETVVKVRMGLHSGEPKSSGERYVGIGVHRAARVGATAHGGQILLSDTTRALVEDDLPPGVTLRELGFFRLKDIERPERLSQLVVDGLPSEFPPLRSAEAVRPPLLRRRSLLAATLAGVIAAAIAIPVFALGRGGSSNGGSARADVAADAVGFFSSADRLTGQAPVGVDASAVAAGGGDVWVASVGGGTVSRVDVRTKTRVQTITVGASPSAVTVADGFVWVANSLSGTISKIDPNANGGAVVDTIPVGNGPAGVAVTNGRLWVANATDRTVMEIPLGTHRPKKTFEFPGGADAIAAGFGYVWVVNSASNTVTRIDARSGTLLPPIGVGNDPRAIAAGANAVWVANSLDGTVSRIDPEGAGVRGIAVGGAPAGIATSPDAVWVSDGHLDRVSRIDASGNVGQQLRTGSALAGVAVAGDSLVVATSSAGPRHRGGTLRVSAPDFDSIDPAIAYLPWAWQALSITNDGLVTFNRVAGSDGARLVPDLATSIPAPSADGRTYTFQMRRGIQFSTGAVVQPVDIRRAIERSVALWHASPDGTGFYFLGIVGANRCTARHCDLSGGISTDARTRTITFHLVSSDPDFLYKLADSSAYAVPVDAPFKPDSRLPATGPYMVLRYRPHHSLVLTRNPRFRVWDSAAQPSGYPERIVWSFRPAFDPKRSPAAVAEAVAAVRAGRLDYTDDAATAAPALRRDGFGNRLHVSPAVETDYFDFNTRVAPFDNADARRAVNYAIDRTRLAALAPGFATTCEVIPPNMAGYVRYCPYTVNLARARRLVAASGTRGQTVNVLLFAGRTNVLRSRYLASVLRQLGYRARLRAFHSYPKLQAARSNVRGFQIDKGGWAADYPSTFDFFHPILVCTSYRPPAPDYDNVGGFCDPRIDREVRRAASLQVSDPAAAAAVWAKIDRDVVDVAPWVPVGNPENIDFTARRVGNYQYNPQFFALLDQLWVR